MIPLTSPKRLAIAAAPVLTLALVVPLAVASQASAQSSHASSRATKKVIVMLRNPASLPASGTRRFDAVRATQAPVTSQLRSSGARNVTQLTAVNAVVATVTGQEAAALAANPAVKKVVPDVVIHGPTLPVERSATPLAAASGRVPSSAYCGTKAKPELDPEALTNIHATPAENGKVDGSGVTVAYMAEGINPANPDFQRNPAYASNGSPAGSRVIKSYQDFSSDGTAAPTSGLEAFLDASSIAAQGNKAYDLSKYVVPAHPLPSGCDIKIVGAAPGADVMGLKVFAQNNATTESAFIQAINYAVTHGVKVLNESFGSNPFPDTALDVTREADNAAIAAGVTVVVSSGDSGPTSTIGSPASDPNVISVGATTTFRPYAQDSLGGINDPKANGRFINNNISALSSGGVAQDGRTVDLVAPGDSSWVLCTANVAMYSDCTNDKNQASPITLVGGTSESAPLTSAAAADVIQAYASTHGGHDPSPALIKRIIVSTTSDVDAPADEQGAGLLNVHAAVKEAKSLPGPKASHSRGTLVSPGQIDVEQHPGTTTDSHVTLTNTGHSSETVKLSTRALTHRVASESRSFCMQPGKPTKACPANTGHLIAASGANEVYQNESFTVPATSATAGSRLVFRSDYQNTGQTSVVHLALLEPNGTFAANSFPVGFADYAETEVADPVPGKWTAVFYTAANNAKQGLIGSKGPVQWNASTYQYAPGSAISPSSVKIPAGASRTATVALAASALAGDTDQSIVIATPHSTTTVPVIQRTLIPTSNKGGSFRGVLTGGNGDEAGVAQTSTFDFDIPSGASSVHATVSLANDPADQVIGYLVDPNGSTVGYSGNATTDNFGNETSTTGLDLYHVNPVAGQWRLVIDLVDPVTGNELTEPFHGAIHFNQGGVSNNLPSSSSTQLSQGKKHTFTVNVANNGAAPQAFFADPRSTTSETIHLADFTGDDQGMTLPLTPASEEPLYPVPTQTSKLTASITGTVPVTFDFSYLPGDPDISPEVSGAGAKAASVTLSEPEVSPGLWGLVPAEVGPYGADAAPHAKASTSVEARLKAFDPTVTSSTGDLWTAINGLSAAFSPQYVPVGDSTSIKVAVTPSAAVGTTVHGVVYVDDYTLSGSLLPDGDELAAIPYEYTVGP